MPRHGIIFFLVPYRYSPHWLSVHLQPFSRGWSLLHSNQLCSNTWRGKFSTFPWNFILWVSVCHLLAMEAMNCCSSASLQMSFNMARVSSSTEQPELYELGLAMQLQISVVKFHKAPESILYGWLNDCWAALVLHVVHPERCVSIFPGLFYSRDLFCSLLCFSWGGQCCFQKV